MKTNMLTLASAAALTMSVALPVSAAPTAVSDAALDAISGKDNTSTVNGQDSTTIGGGGIDGNVQVGYYQWDDDHQTDSSLNKGGNLQSGEQSQVQQFGAAEANALAWGAVAQSITQNTGDGNTIGESQTIEDWATMYIGGF
jgi:hypothetical protein